MKPYYITCSNCGTRFDMIKEPEYCMGTVRCPNRPACGKLLDENTGKAVADYPGPRHPEWEEESNESPE
jgi:hypothetical protein